MLQSIQAFKPGKHRAVDGKVYEFSEAQVAEIAASYDPALSAAPIVLGHPKMDDPAWGWVKGLRVDEAGALVPEYEKVDPAFAEGVEAGRYRYTSAAFYAPDDSRNPKPGTWYLRHIGYLGATPPSVKGLRAAFSEEEAGFVAFGAADGYWVKDILRGVRDFFIEKFGLEDADRVIPSYAIDNIEREPAQPGFAEGGQEPTTGQETTPAISASASEGGEPGADAPQADADREAALAAREADVAKREAAFAEADRAAARAEDGVFLDGLVSEGRLPPAQRDRAAALFARLGGDTTVEFAEAGADPRAELRELLDGLGVSIQFAEFARPDGFDPADAMAAPQIASRIRELIAEAAARGEHLSPSQAAARL
ncbi:MAG: peptidase [Phenylobacterium sp.]|uniref:hypothetical protein n=1 Tax=Phenylobacterium sp. TaxID=1871053 RepID=UPI0017BCFCC6|nr:hypothetical protein [Phenylobacterium sp.]MBA4792294.1 peptidase [Phenylobacterium sp.]